MRRLLFYAETMTYTMCRKQQEKMGTSDGMNYAPVGKPKPVVKLGEFVITAIYKAGFTVCL